MKKRLFYLFIFFIIIGLGYLFFTSYKNNLKRQQFVLNQFKFEENIISSIKKLELQNNDLQIKDQMFYWGTDSTHKYKLSSILKENKLFFFFSEKTCTPCIEHLIDAINKEFSPEEQINKIFFVSSDCPFRFRNNCFNKKLLTLCNKEIGIPLEKKNFSFFFVLDSNMKIKHLHIHSKVFSSLSDTYLREIKERLK